MKFKVNIFLIFSILFLSLYGCDKIPELPFISEEINWRRYESRIPHRHPLFILDRI